MPVNKIVRCKDCGKTFPVSDVVLDAYLEYCEPYGVRHVVKSPCPYCDSSKASLLVLDGGICGEAP